MGAAVVPLDVVVGTLAEVAAVVVCASVVGLGIVGASVLVGSEDLCNDLT